jgi:hypothetical protein
LLVAENESPALVAGDEFFWTRVPAEGSRSLIDAHGLTLDDFDRDIATIHSRFGRRGVSTP